MSRHYAIFVEFCASFDGRMPVTQTLDVNCAERELSVLLEALDVSAGVATIKVFHKSQVSGHLTKLMQDDLTTAFELVKLK